MDKKEVLLIEDEPSLTAMYQAVFRESPYELLIARDAKSGFKMALEKTPSLILLDIILPEDVNPLYIPENVDINHDAASIKIDYHLSGNVLTFNEDLKIKLRTIPAEKYSGFKEVIDKVHQLPEQTLIMSLALRTN